MTASNSGQYGNFFYLFLVLGLLVSGCGPSPCHITSTLCCSCISSVRCSQGFRLEEISGAVVFRHSTKVSWIGLYCEFFDGELRTAGWQCWTPHAAVHNLHSWRWTYRCPKHVELFMIINHNCCIKMVPLVIFIRSVKATNIIEEHADWTFIT